MSEELRRGLDLVTEIAGKGVSEHLAKVIASDEFGARIQAVSVSVGGAAWASAGLERRMQSVAVMTALIATRQLHEFKTHVGFALRNGLTPRELEGLLVQLIPYLGVPAIASAREVVEEVVGKVSGD